MKLDIPRDNNTVAIAIPYNEEDAGNVKRAYESMLEDSGVSFKYHKDAYYKRPFWKWWGIGNCRFAVYKLNM